MRILTHIIMVAVALGLLLSCTDDFAEQGYRMEKQPYYLTLSSNSIVAEAGGGGHTFQLEVDADWHWAIACAEEWLTVTPQEGIGPAVVTVQFAVNWDTVSREGALRVTLQEKPDIVQQVTVSQQTYAVDLGLSVRWASCNMGARFADEAGDYFRWGETTPAQSDWSETGYWNAPDYAVADISGDPLHDAATAQWGTAWRMPTQEEVDELFARCTIVQEGDHYRVTGPNGQSITFPLAGMYLNGTYYPDERPTLWCATSDGKYAHFYRIPDIPQNTTHGFSSAFTVRAVCRTHPQQQNATITPPPHTILPSCFD